MAKRDRTPPDICSACERPHDEHPFDDCGNPHAEDDEGEEPAPEAERLRDEELREAFQQAVDEARHAVDAAVVVGAVFFRDGSLSVFGNGPRPDTVEEVEQAMEEAPPHIATQARAVKQMLNDVLQIGTPVGVVPVPSQGDAPPGAGTGNGDGTGDGDDGDPPPPPPGAEGGRWQ